jgi:hypothetical protein
LGLVPALAGMLPNGLLKKAFMHALQGEVTGQA